MSKNNIYIRRKIKVEIWEGDPFGTVCCKPNIGAHKNNSAKQIRNMLIDRRNTIKMLEKELGNFIEIERNTVKLDKFDLPEYFKQAIIEEGYDSLPFIFINDKKIISGKFPSYDEFRSLLKPYLESIHK
ncbi:unnamed protein product [marine sediment metagenome]|uniref:Thioredoxin-like fold domain-containing protein n=1 Tax=marine sediment metagenome TaxID=412755 RepID=X1A1K4_9ZZZZ